VGSPIAFVLGAVGGIFVASAIHGYSATAECRDRQVHPDNDEQSSRKGTDRKPRGAEKER
jgi:hypothetical protein